MSCARCRRVPFLFVEFRLCLCGHNSFLAFAFYLVFIPLLALFIHCRQASPSSTRFESTDSLKIGKIFSSSIFSFLRPALPRLCCHCFPMLRMQSAAVFAIHIRQLHGVSLALTLSLLLRIIFFLFSLILSIVTFSFCFDLFCSNFD